MYRALDSHFKELLAMSSIIILQRKNDYGEKINEFFSADILTKAHCHQRNALDFDKTIATDISDSIKKTLKDLQSNTITINAARVELLSLAVETEGCEKKVILAVESILPAINDLDVKNFDESHLTASFIHPIMQALFSLDNSNHIAHCSNNIVTEIEDTNKRPDYVVDLYQHYNYSYTSCYGEIKSVGVSNVNKIMDFYRLCLFSKGGIETQNLDKIIFFLAIGLEITFYAMASPCSTIRAAIELGTITIPALQKDLLSFMSILDTLLSIATVHNNIRNDPDANMPVSSSPTIPYEFLETKATQPKKEEMLS